MEMESDYMKHLRSLTIPELEAILKQKEEEGAELDRRLEEMHRRKAAACSRDAGSGNKIQISSPSAPTPGAGPQRGIGNHNQNSSSPVSASVKRKFLREDENDIADKRLRVEEDVPDMMDFEMENDAGNRPGTRHG